MTSSSSARMRSINSSCLLEIFYRSSLFLALKFFIYSIEISLAYEVVFVLLFSKKSKNLKTQKNLHNFKTKKIIYLCQFAFPK